MPVDNNMPKRPFPSGIRRAIRFFTKFISDLDRESSSDRLITERRILLELLDHPEQENARLGRALGMERAQLSRALKKLMSEGLISDRTNPNHARQRIRYLSREGEKVAQQISDGHDEAIRTLFDKMPPSEKDFVTSTIGANDIDTLPEVFKDEIEILPIAMSDYSWIFSRIALTQAATKWNHHFFAAASAAISDFCNSEWYDNTQTGWIAHFRGKPVGGILMTIPNQNDHAKIAFFQVDTIARGRGIGSLLLDTCLDAALDMTLSTLSVQVPDNWHAERAMLEKHNFSCVESKDADFRYGPMTLWHDYTYNLPLYEPKS